MTSLPKKVQKTSSHFANKIQQFPLGSRADNLEIAIASYQAALEVYSYWFYGQISKQPA